MEYERYSETQLEDIITSKHSKIKLIKEISRIDWWWLFFTLIKKKLETSIMEVSNEDKVILLKIEVLIKLLNSTNKLILNAENTIVRKLYEIKLDVINRYLEEHTIYAEENKYIDTENIDFNYYPEYSNVLFNKKIFEKKEFYENTIPKMNSDTFNTKKKSFKRSASQKFVKNFISNNTPYNGMLLWHGVGVGKTCAAISIAENFRSIVYQNDKKILVLTPSDTIQQNWRDEIFSIEKENNNFLNLNVQCTGTKYKDALLDFSDKTYKQKTLMVNRLVNKYYEIMGYQKLTNEIDKYFNSLKDFYKESSLENKKIKYIKEKFSNRIIIMDEVHVTREGGSKDDKKSRPYLEMIARYADNTKLILLTATPMYNISKEIIWLINLLLWNDKQSPLEEEHIFQKNGIDLVKYSEDKKNIREGREPKALEDLIKKSRGYISYLRGENPFIFPLKLEPEEKFLYTPNPTFKTENKRWKQMEETEKIHTNNIRFYKNSLSLWQYNKLKEYLADTDDSTEYEPTKKIQSSFSRQPLQASNIVYPQCNFKIDEGDLKGELKGNIGEKKGLEGAFNVNEGKYSYKNESGVDLGNMDGNGKGFLHIDYIGKYSKKQESIMSNILSSKGIVFVYSQFISHGIKPMGLTLEENGFKRYVGGGKTDNFLNKKIDINNCFCAYHKKYYRDLSVEERVNFRQATYIYLDGQLKKKHLDQLVREIRGQVVGEDGQIIKNDEGEHIMVILGSRVIEQGISFFGIREIHIMDPWHHLNMMEQAAGRGIRQRSHFHLPKNKRNVTLYLHVAALPESLVDTGLETSDERVYRNAYFKKYKMAEIERILKKNAIDCALNKNSNIFDESSYPEKSIILTSKGESKEVVIYDKDNSFKCDFRNCDYSCDWEAIDPNYKINTDTFSNDFILDTVENIKEFIKLIYINAYSYTLDNIIDIIHEEYNTTLNKDYIYIALDELIQNKETIYDMYNRLGYLIYRDRLYIYQPIEVDDIDIPYYYRGRPVNNRIYNIGLENTDEINVIKSTTSKRFIKKAIKKKTIKKVTNENILQTIQKIKKDLDYSTVSKYIYKEYNNYPKRIEDRSSSFIPIQDELIQIYLFYKIDRLSYREKEILLKMSLKNIIKNGNKPTNKLDNSVLLYFDKDPTNPLDKSYSIFRTKRDKLERMGKKMEALKFKGEDFPKYFRIIKPNHTQIFYEYDSDLNDFVEAISLKPEEEEEFKLKQKDYILINNKSLIYGFLSKIPSTFYVVNNVGYIEETNITGTLKKKKIRKGARCGHGINVTSVNEIAQTINTIIDYKIYSSQIIKKKLTFFPKTRMKQTSVYKGKSLCQELEFLLRYRQSIRSQEEISENIIWFYKIEEIF